MRLADGPSTSGFEDLHLIHNAIPDLDYNDIELNGELFNKTYSYPLLINAITGGTEEAQKINESLAILAEKYGLLMAVGSQTIAIDDDSLIKSFSIVRECNPKGIIIANLSASASINEVKKAIDMISADAIGLHFNVAQELAMFEGDRNFKGVLDNVAKVVELSPVPVIAKEVGFGFSYEMVQALYDTGLRFIDIGGKGGTNFISIEDQRNGLFKQELDDWGISSAVSLAEAVSVQKDMKFIASGGLRTAHDLAKALAIGAELAGIAGLFLKILIKEGFDYLDDYLENYLHQLKAIYLMTGSKNTKELQEKPLIITGLTAEYLERRGIKPEIWSLR